MSESDKEALLELMLALRVEAKTYRSEAKRTSNKTFYLLIAKRNRRYMRTLRKLLA